jgi:AmiR/NasT family two-component response regulator
MKTETISRTDEMDAPEGLLRAANETEAKTSLHKALPWKPGRILVADDEHLAALSVTHCLRELGYTSIGPARDGEHAIELAFSSRPDLALLDVRMADDFDGIDAARVLFDELRIPTVIVSAYSDAKQVEEATIPGVFGYVVKPVTCEQLRPAIEIAWARMRHALEQEIEVRWLRSSIEARKTIERAKWQLVEQLEIDEGAALRHLRKLAKTTQRPVSEVAREIVDR